MAFIKQAEFTKKTTDLPDKPSPAYTASQIKTYMQTPADELKTTVNKLVDDLNVNYWVDRNKIKDLEVIRSKIALGAVGTDQLDPAIFGQPKDDLGIQAKFQDHDEQLAENAKKTGAWINVTENPYNASTTKTATENTTAIQSALDTGKHVRIPKGTFTISNLSMNTAEQHLTFESGAKPLSDGSVGNVITLNADYATINNGFISGGSGGATNGIETKGFRNYLINCTVSGTTVNALTVNGLETSVILGKYKGGTSAGINVLKADLYLLNPYVEGNRDGIYSNGFGSITAHHVHSFNNSRHGFYLSGASYSQLNSCYADTNGANGYEVRDTTEGFTMVDCWGYKSANVTANENDFVFYNSKGVKLIGCSSSGTGAFSKLSSFKFDSLSQIDLIACRANIAPTGQTGLISFINCSGSLRKYNRSTDVFQSLSTDIGASATSSITVRTLVPQLTTTPGMMSFVVTAHSRKTDNSYTASEQFMIVIGSGCPSSVTAMFPSSPKITLANPAFVDGGDGYFNLTFDATNTLTSIAQVSFNVRYLGTGRGYN